MFITEKILKQITEQLNSDMEDRILALELLNALSNKESPNRKDNEAQVMWILRFEANIAFGNSYEPLSEATTNLLNTLTVGEPKDLNLRGRYGTIAGMKYRDILNYGNEKGKAVVLKMFAKKLEKVYSTVPKLKTKITFEYDGVDYL
tara:strand:+ start:1651 stop:2091 length:441 start_codon:yes stop_codon:yes gene_type:complete